MEVRAEDEDKGEGNDVQGKNERLPADDEKGTWGQSEFQGKVGRSIISENGPASRHTSLYFTCIQLQQSRTGHVMTPHSRG